VSSPESLHFATTQNNRTLSLLGDPSKSPNFDIIEGLLNNKDKIPSVVLRNGKLWNFWQDSKNQRGLHRYCDIDDYQAHDNVEDIKWTTVMDFDALGKAEDKR
tara:strand:- start:229 stop:537 length:309 start_codon:yes stop_codon:yes gene_type:complete